jgi:hypothetical protein
MGQMPVQLRYAHRPKRSEPRPTVELMPAISINDLCDVVPRDYSTNTYSNPFRYPQVRHIRLSYCRAEIVDHYDRVQVFGIKWIRTGFGVPRRIFVCSCGRGAIRLFARYGTYACKACHKATYMSRRQSSQGRKRLTACKLRIKLGGLPNINEPLPRKPKWQHRKTYQRLRNQIQGLEAKAKRTRFRKPINTSVFAYHVP